MKKKKILYLSENYPFDQDSGGAIKSQNTILTLNKKFDLLLIYFTDQRKKTNSQIKVKQKGFVLKDIHNPLKKQLGKLLHNYFKLTPYIIFQYFNQNYKEKIEKIIKDFQPDIIHIDHLSMTAYLPKIKKQIWIYEEHNIEQNLYHSIASNTSKIKRKFFYTLEYWLIKNYENKILPKFDHIFAICRNDQQWLKTNLKLKNVSTQNLVVKLQKNKKVVAQKTDSKNLLFIGDLNWQPNYEAVNWFVKKILPIITKSEPKISLNVVGKKPPLLSLPKNKHVIYHGYQKNLNQYLNKATIFIIPIKSGGGIRVKALTAASNKIAIVTTNKGIEGLQFKANQDFLLANDEKKFSQKVLELLKNEQLRKKIISNAFKRLEENYGKQQNQNFVKKYEEITQLFFIKKI